MTDRFQNFLLIIVQLLDLDVPVFDWDITEDQQNRLDATPVEHQEFDIKLLLRTLLGIGPLIFEPDFSDTGLS